MSVQRSCLLLAIRCCAAIVTSRRVLLADVAVTNAIFYRPDRWRPVGSGRLANCTSCVVQAFLPVGGEGETTTTEADPLVIASIHLDAQKEDRRVRQLQRCLEQALSCAPATRQLSCVVAGDFNCELFDGSCVRAFLAGVDLEADGARALSSPPSEAEHVENRKRECASALRLSPDVPPSKEQLHSWDELHASATTFVRDRFLALRRLDTGCTRATYDHDEDLPATSDRAERRMRLWRLDHMLYTAPTLAPRARWSTLEDDERSAATGLPNDRVPTDHLPIAAAFARRAAPRLGPAAEEGLIRALEGLAAAQREATRAHGEEAARTRRALEKVHAATEDGEATGDADAKPAKRPKKKPHPDIIRHVRESRAALKTLKAEQRRQREEFIGSKTVLEKMVLQHHLGEGRTCAEWVESGQSP